MMHLISYDVTNNRLRLRIAKQLLKLGCYRIQLSVFMGTLSERNVKRLEKELRQCIQSPDWATDDTILVLPLHQYSRDELFFLGKTPSDWALIQQNLHTLVL